MDESKEGWGNLQTIGYAERGARERIEAFLAHSATALIDIRLVPFCRWETAWNKAQLAAAYGPQYIHLMGLGNVNKGTNQPIKLLDPDRQIQRIASAIRRGRSMILLCGCAHYAQCHRKTVYDLVIATLEAEKAQTPSG